jgi:plasmid maintenance system antidote protein VapI
MGKSASAAESLSEVLRRAIRESGVPYLTLAQATGVQRASIQRFIDGRTSIRLDKADKLAAYFGLALVKKG